MGLYFWFVSCFGIFLVEVDDNAPGGLRGGSFVREAGLSVRLELHSLTHSHNTTMLIRQLPVLLLAAAGAVEGFQQTAPFFLLASEPWALNQQT